VPRAHAGKASPARRIKTEEREPKLQQGPRNGVASGGS
jgi:hypothetical protein